MTKILLPFTLVLSTFAAMPSFAHGDGKAQHGGIVQMAEDLSFELVDGGDCVILYINDHGKPYSPTGMSGKLTLLKGNQKTEFNFTLQNNTLKAHGAQFAKGDKAIANLTTKDKKNITVRFAHK